MEISGTISPDLSHSKCFYMSYGDKLESVLFCTSQLQGVTIISGSSLSVKPGNTD
jgi:hypothetical protein